MRAGSTGGGVRTCVRARHRVEARRPRRRLGFTGDVVANWHDVPGLGAQLGGHGLGHVVDLDGRSFRRRPVARVNGEEGRALGIADEQDAVRPKRQRSRRLQVRLAGLQPRARIRRERRRNRRDAQSRRIQSQTNAVPHGASPCPSPKLPTDPSSKPGPPREHEAKCGHPRIIPIPHRHATKKLGQARLASSSCSFVLVLFRSHDLAF